MNDLREWYRIGVVGPLPVRPARESLVDARARTRIDPGIVGRAHSARAMLRARLAESCPYERRMRYEWELRHLTELAGASRFPGTS